MGDRLLEWQSFWDVATPRYAAQALLEHYSIAARQVAEHCASFARADQRNEDYDFWMAVLDELQDTGAKCLEAANAQDSAEDCAISSDQMIDS